jgi:hypothetical protein
MSDPTELAVVHINNYLWALASGSVSGVSQVSSAVWNVNSYDYRPFYPVTESLAPDSAQMPYILYDYIFAPKSGTFWPMQKEEADYIIVGDIPQIYYLKNWIVDALERFDESAGNINNYLVSNTTASYNPSVRFKYLTVDQDNYIADEKRIDSFLPKFITCLKITYEYTK